MVVVEKTPESKQEWLDELVRRSREGFFPAYFHGECAYRTTNGRACAIGVLVPDEKYKHEEEVSGPGAFLRACDSWPSWLDAKYCQLNEIQRVHDDIARTCLNNWPHDVFVRRLLDTSYFWGMAPTTLAEEKQ